MLMSMAILVRAVIGEPIASRRSPAAVTMGPVRNTTGSSSPSALIRVAMVLIIAAAVVAWVAIGDSVEGSEANHQAAAAALAHGIALAEITTSGADQLQHTVDALVVGTGSTGEAMTHTIAISRNVQSLLGIVKGLESTTSNDDMFVEIQSGLAEAQASLLETQGGLDETQQSITAAQPIILTAITALEMIPDQLRSAQADLAKSDGTYGDQLGLWRTAVLVGALGLLLAFAAVDRLSRS